MNRTIRIGILTEGGVLHDVFSYYRVVGPFAALRKFASTRGINIELTQVLQIGWHTLRNLDVLYLHRPYTSNDLEAIKMAKENGVKTWVDVDDNYFNLLPWFRHYCTYTSPEVRRTMRSIYTEVNLVTVSTRELAEQLKAEVPVAEIEVVPNGYPLNINRLDPFPDLSAKAFTRAISWRGTEESTKDLITFAPTLVKFLTENKVGLFSWGIYPWPLVEAGLPPEYIKARGLSAFEDFYETLKRERPLAHLKLHEDRPFHRCRSHCALFEATHAGTVLVAPDFEEWERPNVVRFKPDTLENCLTYAINMQMAQRTQEFHKAFDLITSQYNQEDGALPEKRLKLLLTLV